MEGGRFFGGKGDFGTGNINLGFTPPNGHITIVGAAVPIEEHGPGGVNEEGGGDSV